jgi:hypothetical protein
MKTPGGFALAEVASKARDVEVACSRCDRRGRYQLARLVEQLGADFLMTDLGAELASCANRHSSAHGERCDVFFPRSRGDPAWRRLGLSIGSRNDCIALVTRDKARIRLRSRGPIVLRNLPQRLASACAITIGRPIDSPTHSSMATRSSSDSVTSTRMEYRRVAVIL